VRDDVLSGLQVGVVAAVIPDPLHPEFSVYWLRDACLVYHPWLNELTVLGDKSLRPMADDLTHALVRTQQVISLAGNVFSGGIEEAVFDIKINPIQSEDARIGSPAASESFARVAHGHYKLITTLTLTFSSLVGGMHSCYRIRSLCIVRAILILAVC